MRKYQYRLHIVSNIPALKDGCIQQPSFLLSANGEGAYMSHYIVLTKVRASDIIAHSVLGGVKYGRDGTADTR